MYIDQRDLSILHFISSFHQLTSHHLQQLIFNDMTSHTPLSRSVNRLVDRRYLARIERRLVGGARGGAGQYVYQLGPEGWRMAQAANPDDPHWRGRWSPDRAIHPHTLAIADCYVALDKLRRQGVLTMPGYSTEPDCHVTIRDGLKEYVLRPDLYAEIARPDGSKPLRLMFEVDMGTQGQKQITQKLMRYWNASGVAGGDEWPAGQLVVFIAVDEHRATELRWLLDKGKPEQRGLVKVHTLDSFVMSLS